jgi:hypothetical protein
MDTGAVSTQKNYVGEHKHEPRRMVPQKKGELKGECGGIGEILGSCIRRGRNNVV